MGSPPQRILVVRHDAIGDTLLSLPAIHALRQAYPECHITVVTSPAAAAVLANDTVEVLAVKDPHGVTPPPADWAFAFTEKMWAYRWLRRSGATVRAGFWPGRSKPFKCLQLAPLLTHRVHSAEAPGADQGLHEVERYGLLLQSVGCTQGLGPVRMAIPAAARQWGEEWATTHRVRGRTAVHLSEKWFRHGWPRDFLRRLVKQLDAVVLYGPAEADWANDIPADVRFFDPDLKRYAAVLSQLGKLVTMDTSAAHLAASVGLPLVDVFGPVHFAHNTTRWKPWMVPHRIVQKPDWSADAEATLLEGLVQATTGLEPARL